MGFSWVGDAWQLARRVDRLFEGFQKQTRALEALTARVEELERELITVKAERDRMVTKARSAATAASSAVIGQLAMEMSALKERVASLPRLPPPSSERA
jgi:phage shock protein A